METILAFGYKGQLLVIGKHEDIETQDAKILEEGANYPLMTHHAEISFLQEPVALTTSTMDPGYHVLRRGLEPIYRDYGKYGDFGDVLFVTKAAGFYYLTAIGKKAYRLPAFAADLLPIVTDGSGQKFFLGIVRGDNGHRATVGGFMDIKNCELESAPECLTHEAWEEIGLKLQLRTQPTYDFTTTPFPASEGVTYDLLGETGYSAMMQLGVFYSPAANLRPQFSTKRVHAAVAYLVEIKLEQTVSVDILRDALACHDKMENNQIFVWNMADGDPGLRTGHKHMYDEAKRFISQ